MHITVISICHKDTLTTTAYHQNKSYSKETIKAICQMKDYSSISISLLYYFYY